MLWEIIVGLHMLLHIVITQKTEIFRLGFFLTPTVPRCLDNIGPSGHSGKPHKLSLENVNSQHVFFT